MENQTTLESEKETHDTNSREGMERNPPLKIKHKRKRDQIDSPYLKYRVI